MITIDHMGISAHDASKSARTLAAILGASEPTLDGADEDMYRVNIDGSFLLFSDAASFAQEHVAFHVSDQQFVHIITKLRECSSPFGNDPEDLANGLTDDPLGTGQRVYWLDDNGHLFEACC